MPATPLCIVSSDNMLYVLFCFAIQNNLNCYLQEELDTLAERYSSHFNVYYVLNQVSCLSYARQFYCYLFLLFICLICSLYCLPFFTIETLVFSISWCREVLEDCNLLISFFYDFFPCSATFPNTIDSGESPCLAWLYIENYTSTATPPHSTQPRWNLLTICWGTKIVLVII
jgi:hypothetical protein